MCPVGAACCGASRARISCSRSSAWTAWASSTARGSAPIHSPAGNNSAWRSRALAQQPEVIVADEPIASLDPQSSAGILELLRDISRNDGVALVCSLHQLEFARAYADRIAGITAGAVVVDVPASQFDDTAATRVYGVRLASA